jgi:hypothetical protein
MDDSTRNSTPQLADVEQAKYLWEEYRYRHDLIWRLLFRMTAVAVLLSIAPFTIDDLAEERAGAWVDALPAIALALVAISWLVLLFELSLFNPIDRVYTAVQDKAVGKKVREEAPDVFAWVVRRKKVREEVRGKKVREEAPDVFVWVVRVYPIVLFALLLVVALIAWSRG